MISMWVNLKIEKLWEISNLFFQYFQSYVSDILVAMNPCKIIDELYTADTIRKYEGVSIGLLPPHVFGIGECLNLWIFLHTSTYSSKYIPTADEVKRSRSIYQKPQSVVISGETGSGKTETSKLILKFLCGLKSSHFAQLMIDANILLESFGNSRTTENLNSSRFIKTVQVIFFNFFVLFVAKLSMKA